MQMISSKIEADVLLSLQGLVANNQRISDC